MIPVAAALLAVLVLAAGELGAAEVRDLAAEAATDPTAVADLGSVTSVEGGPVALDDVLRRSNGGQFEVIQALPVSGIEPAAVESAVARVLEAPAYADRTEGWWDRIVRQVGAFLVSFFERVTSWLGGSLVAAIVAAVVLAGLTAAIVARLARRRARDIERTEFIRRILESGDDPGALEDQADAAASQGDYSAAIRLRFVAGLLRLDQQGRIAYRPGLATHDIQATVADPAFDALVGRFEEVVYGQRAADAAHDRESRDGWDRVLRRVRA